MFPLQLHYYKPNPMDLSHVTTYNFHSFISLHPACAIHTTHRRQLSTQSLVANILPKKKWSGTESGRVIIHSVECNK